MATSFDGAGGQHSYGNDTSLMIPSRIGCDVPNGTTNLDGKRIGKQLLYVPSQRPGLIVVE